MKISVILFICSISIGILFVLNEPEYNIYVSKISDNISAVDCNGKDMKQINKITDIFIRVISENISAVDCNGKIIASGTANFDDAYVIQKAFNSLPNGGVISFDNSEYNISKEISVVGKNFTMQGNKTKFNINTEINTPGFYFAGYRIKTFKIPSDALNGTDMINLNNTTGAMKGDLILVYNDIKWCPSDNPLQKTGELYTVKNISGKSVQLNSNLIRDYTTKLNSKAIIYRPATVKIGGCTFIGTGASDPVMGVQLKYCINSNISDCYCDKNGLFAFGLYTCYGVEICKNEILNSNMQGLGYGVAILNACTNITVKDNDIRICRHCITSGRSEEYGVNRDVYILNNILYNGIGDVIDAHPFTINYEVTNNTIYSGPYAAFSDGTTYSIFSNNKVYGESAITKRGQIPNCIKKITGNYLEGNSLIYEDTQSISDLYISNNKIISNNASEVIYLINMSINNLVITNNTITSGKKGIFVDVGNISNTDISGNIIENVQKSGIAIDSINNISIYQNIIKNANLGNGDYNAIDLYNVKYTNIYKNKISGDCLQTGYGIYEDTHSDYNSIYSNWIENMSLGAVYIQGPHSTEKDNGIASNESTIPTIAK